MLKGFRCFLLQKVSSLDNFPKFSKEMFLVDFTSKSFFFKKLFSRTNLIVHNLERFSFRVKTLLFHLQMQVGF